MSEKRLNNSSSSSLYTFAIARELPDSFAHALCEHYKNDDGNDDNNNEKPEEVDMVLARQQHDAYITELRKHVPTICLPALENHPDCLFVEDTVIVIGRRAVLTNPGHISRQGEVDSIRELLRQLGCSIYDMRTTSNCMESNRIVCDGGDVLYTGRHLFVGLSQRTTDAAVQFLQTAFRHEDDMQVVGIPVPPSVLHLKSAVTHMDETTLVLPTGAVGEALETAMEVRSRGYDVIRVPNVLACNLVVLNGHVMAQDTDCQESRRVIQEAATSRGLTVSWVNTKELAKKDAALTCCSVLLKL